MFKSFTEEWPFIVRSTFFAPLYVRLECRDVWTHRIEQLQETAWNEIELLKQSGDINDSGFWYFRSNVLNICLQNVQQRIPHWVETEQRAILAPVLNTYDVFDKNLAPGWLNQCAFLMRQLLQRMYFECSLVWRLLRIRNEVSWLLRRVWHRCLLRCYAIESNTAVSEYSKELGRFSSTFALWLVWKMQFWHFWIAVPYFPTHRRWFFFWCEWPTIKCWSS
jgi:hypothetical protein